MTKQETGLGLIDEVLSKWEECDNCGSRLTCDCKEADNFGLMEKELKSHFSTYFQNEKLEIEKGCGEIIENDIAGNTEIETYICGRLCSPIILKRTLCLECQAKLHQLNKDAKNILGGEV